jgi:hypothetical protein
MGERLACLINIGFAGQPDEARGCSQAIVLSPETLLASNHNTQPSVSVLQGHVWLVSDLIPADFE